jgi:hypothetical protein
VKKTKFRFSTVSVTTGDSAELGPGHRCLLWSLHFHPELPREAGEEEMWGEGLWRARDHPDGPGGWAQLLPSLWEKRKGAGDRAREDSLAVRWVSQCPVRVGVLLRQRARWSKAAV